MENPSRSVVSGQCPILSIPPGLLEAIMERVMEDEEGFRRAAMACRGMADTLDVPELQRRVHLRGRHPMTEPELIDHMQSVGTVTSLKLDMGALLCQPDSSKPAPTTGTAWTTASRSTSHSTTHTPSASPSATDAQTEAVTQQTWAKELRVLSVDCTPCQTGGESPLVPWTGCRSGGLHHEAPRSPSLTCFPQLTSLTDLSLKGLTSESLPPNLSTLVSLKRLSVSECEHLRQLPEELSALRSLAQIHVRDCISARSILPKLGEHLKTSLRQLTFVGRSGLSSLPSDLHEATGLQVLTLLFFQEVPDPPILAQIPCINAFSLQFTCIEVPESLRRVLTVRKLRLEGSRSRSIQSENFQGLPRLRELLLFYENLERIPAGLAIPGNNSELRTLGLFCRRLHHVPPTFGTCSSLKELAVSGCMNMAHQYGRPWSLASLTSNKLQVLCLTFLSEPLPVSAAKDFKWLKDLRLRCLPAFADVPLSLIQASLQGFINELPVLERLTLCCHHPETYPDSLYGVPHLRHLDLGCGARTRGREGSRDPRGRRVNAECRAWERVADTWSRLWWEETFADELGRTFAPGFGSGLLSDLRSLLSLRLNCCQMVGLPDSLGSLTCLKSLVLEESDTQELPRGLMAMSRLTSLGVLGCRNLQNLHLDESLPRAVRKLHIAGCRPKSFPGAGAEVLESLTDLTLGCTLLQLQPPDLSRLRFLSSFTVAAEKCQRRPHTDVHSTLLPESLGSLPCLKRITSFAPCVVELPLSLTRLAGLESVDMGPSADNFHHLLSMPPLGSLRRLQGWSRDRLARHAEWLWQKRDLTTDYLPSSLHCILNLSKLRLHGYLGTELPTSLSQLQKLTSLTVEKCRQLQGMFMERASLPELEDLAVMSCPRLSVISGIPGVICNVPGVICDAQGRGSYPLLRVRVMNCPLLDLQQCTLFQDRPQIEILADSVPEPLEE